MHAFSVLIALASVPLFAASSDLSGQWDLQAPVRGDEHWAHMSLKIDGPKLSGTLNEDRLDGTVRDGAVEFTARRPGGQLFGTFHGVLKDGELIGDAVWFETQKVTWVARRPVKRPATPTVHNFEPKEFHRVFSSAIPPVMHIFPGDTVRTWTVDAGGRDQHGESRSGGGNPETGPFYIEGAFPGDTLVIKLNRVRLNRDTAESGSEIAYNAVTADYVHDAKYDEKFQSEWKLDREKSIARLANPSQRLRNYTVKLRPMLGCLAVAPPAKQAFRTGYLGPFGGNMDYTEMREGTTLYLPVFEKGALFFLGDGHAAQGDGELTGDALETSMDVEFTVDVIQGTATEGPRAENADYLMSMGIAGSVGDAIQMATSQLALWLEKDYRLNANESAVVLGTAVRYDIAEVVDPQYHAVAKIAKSALAALNRE
ncbi:MAG: acetamidase/formamidase family protein [Bryobacteraceae bacterium]